MKKKILLFVLILALQNCFSQTPFYPTNNVSGFNFGSNVDISNTDVLVSSSSALVPFVPKDVTGKVYLFNITNQGIQQTEVFYPSDALASDAFGASISIQNDFITIGSPLHDVNFTNSGAVYLYKRVNNVWQFQQKITAFDGSTGDNFGSFVKVYNNQLFVSAGGVKDNIQNIESNTGAVYVYTFNGTEWIFSEKLIPSSPLAAPFGKKIEVENNTLVISSGNAGGLHPSNIHYLSVYQLDNSNWILSKSGEVGNLEQNVYDFSLSNNQIFYIYNYIRGSNGVSIMSIDNPDWLFLNSSFDFPKSDQIYTVIKVNDGKMFIGSGIAGGYILQIERNFPVLYYKKIGNDWIYQSTLHGTGTFGEDDYFGASIASQGNSIIIGAPQETAILPFGKAYYIDATSLSSVKFEKNLSAVYPNPTLNPVFIKNNSLNSIEKVEVYAITGNLLFSEDQNFEQLSLEKLPQGIYLIKLDFNNGTNETFKIIKK